MKTKILSSILLFAVILLSNCKEDPCEGKTCLNGGTCVDGVCQCADHYEGASCADQETPAKVIITKIVVTKFPATEASGGGWDLSSGPDLIPIIAYSNDEYDYVGNAYAENATPGSYTFTPITQLQLSPLTLYGIALVDYDDTDPDDIMEGFDFTPYSDSNQFPEIIELKGAKVEMSVFVKYTF
jgi:hypothetical protein